MLTNREKRQQKTRQSILTAARQIISEQGPEQLSMRALAERIDYSPAGLYEYFSSKEDILHAVCLDGHQQLTAAIRAVDAALPPAEYLIRIGLAYVRFAVSNPQTYLLMFTNAPSGDVVSGLLDEVSSYPILRQAIRDGLDQGIFKTRAGFGLQEIAYAAWGIVHGLAMLRITTLRETPIPPDADENALVIFTRGLQAPD
jgi:AcrR family transcriptional regulator